MEWMDYYFKFSDWSESTQINRISSLTNFTSSEEVCEIAECFYDEVPASRLVNRALDHGLVFTTDEIVVLCELVTKDTLKKLLSTCKQSFTINQISTIEENSAMFYDEIKSLVTTTKNLNAMSWQQYYSVLYNLTEDEAATLALTVSNFTSTDEIVDAYSTLIYAKGANDLIGNALNQNVRFSRAQIEDMIDYNNEKTAELLVFSHMNLFAPDDVYYLEDYLSATNLKRFAAAKGFRAEKVKKEKGVSFITKLAAGFALTEFLHWFFGGNKNDE